MEIDGEAQAGIAQAGDLPGHGSSQVLRIAGKGGVGHHHVELRRFAPHVQGAGVGDQAGVDFQVGIGQGGRGIEHQPAFRVDVARDQEIDPDGCVRIGPRLDFLGLRMAYYMTH